MYGIPNFNIIDYDLCEESKEGGCEGSNSIKTKAATPNLKFNLKISTIPDRKYKCKVLADLLFEDDFEDVYVNQNQGILHVFVYAESEKRAKFKLWKIIKRNDLIDFFNKIEVQNSVQL